MIIMRRRLFCWKWCSNSRLLLSYTRQSLTLCEMHRHIRYFSILKKSFISDLSLDIDLNGLKDEQRHQLKLGNRVNIHKLVNDELERRCSDVINQFTVNKSRMLKAVQLEHNFMHAEGYSVYPPELMTCKNWIEALTYSSKDERLTYYLFLQHKALTQARKLSRREEIKKLHGELDGDTDKSFIFYDDVTSHTRWGNYGLASAMTHGIPLVFDMNFDDSMTPKEMGHCAKQMWYTYCFNRTHPNPFHFVFTGCKKTNTLYRTFELRHLLNCHHLLVSETENSYMDHFDHSKLVYLSPYAKQVMRDFDPTRVYIIGAYSDQWNSKKFGPAEAKRHNIQCLKFPIDDSIKWIQGTKDLAMPSVIKVLLSVKGGETWKDALGGALTSKNFRHYSES